MSTNQIVQRWLLYFIHFHKNRIFSPLIRYIHIIMHRPFFFLFEIHLIIIDGFNVVLTFLDLCFLLFNAFVNVFSRTLDDIKK